MLAIVAPVVLATTAAVLVLTRLLDVASSQGRLKMIRTALGRGRGHQRGDDARAGVASAATRSDKAAVRHGAL
ncbi:hypothetical protein [Actinokineospora sp. UTMC 2448]|uniref:hypothetical protein n=1 Tax=Actinokineospora sp. UTMC 2448 TaxID=2268449 RepID=UPI002164E1D6|nr:hypothetical protein [Actinokineospora sp. UTMC 2448]